MRKFGVTLLCHQNQDNEVKAAAAAAATAEDHRWMCCVDNPDK